MKTAVMTDTNSGIMKAEADSMGIFLIPMQSLSMMRHIMRELILQKILSTEA